MLFWPRRVFQNSSVARTAPLALCRLLTILSVAFSACDLINTFPSVLRVAFLYFSCYFPTTYLCSPGSDLVPVWALGRTNCCFPSRVKWDVWSAEL